MRTGPFRLSFLDNHDMDRFLFVAGNDVERLKMAALCQFALEPTPVIYYGTEIGLRQAGPASDRAAGGDAQVRGDMIWDKNAWDRDLLDFYRRLIGVRRKYAVLRSGGRRTIHVDTDRQTYAFVRDVDRENDSVSAADSSCVLAVFNLGDEARSIELTGVRTGSSQLLIESGAGKVGVGNGKVELEGRGAALVGSRSA